MLKLKVVTQPAVEPVTLTKIKYQLRVEEDDDIYDNELNELIPAARQWCETYQNKAYITQTLELALDSFPSTRKIVLPRPPLQQVESLTLTDHSGNKFTYDPSQYLVDDYSDPSRIIFNQLTSIRLAEANGIIVRYQAGYGDSSNDVPERIKQAIIMLIVHWFENGYCDPPKAVYSLLDLDRVIPI